MSDKMRLDELVVDAGLAPTRSMARSLIMEGKILVDDVPVTKPGKMVKRGSSVRLKGDFIPYVGRGGMKLEGALDDLSIDVSGLLAVDIGASVGGFTDCLLKRGAKRVHAVDVAYGILHPKLRQDDRVRVIERKNARYLSFEDIGEMVDLVTIDVSFISVKKIVPKVSSFLKPGGVLLVLVKPQFEVGKDEVERGGVVRDAEKLKRVLEDIESFLVGEGYEILGVVPSKVRGAKKGNQEYFIAGKKIG